MSFVKLDNDILDSSLWIQRAQREVFITALLMATPWETHAPLDQYEVRSITKTGFVVPPGWYGFVKAAGSGIAARAMIPISEGLDALEQLGRPDPDSRSLEHEGRRLVRVNGGFLVLNYMRFRDRDHGAAERMKRLRERKKQKAVAIENRDLLADVTGNVTHSREQSTEYRKEKDKHRASDVSKTAILAEYAKTEKHGLNGHSFEDAVPPFVQPDTWSLYVQVRRKKRAPMTAEAYRRLLRNLMKHAGAGYDPEKIVARSADSAWIDLYPKNDDLLPGHAAPAEHDHVGTLSRSEID